MTGATSAKLGDLTGRGLLRLETVGYRRVEGTFFTSVEERQRLTRMLMDGPVVYEGPIELEGREHRKIVPVFVGGFREEGGQIRVRITAAGSW